MTAPGVQYGRLRRLINALGDLSLSALEAAQGSKSREIGQIITVALETAARRGEIQSMKWEKVNFATRPRTPKPKLPVPLTRRAVEVLGARLFEKGLNMMEVAAITGHKSLSMLLTFSA